MSAAPRYPVEMGYAGLEMTADAYLAIGETQERYELIEGAVRMSPRPNPRHQLVIRLLLAQIEPYLTATKSKCFPEVDLILGPKIVLAPDIVCYQAGRVRGTPAKLDVPPDLVIEVLSPSNKAFDLTRKREAYARFGVAEYWALDPADVRVRCFRRDGDLLIECAVTGDAVESAGLPGFRLDLKLLRNSAEQE